MSLTKKQWLWNYAKYNNASFIICNVPKQNKVNTLSLYAQHDSNMFSKTFIGKITMCNNYKYP